jgi:hypothetical protein
MIKEEALMNSQTHSHLLFVLIVCVVLLTACDSILQVGVMPTATPVLGIYANDEYGFAFQYPSTWSLAEESNAVRLTRGTRNLYIGYRWAAESVNIWGRTGAPAGDFIYGGKVFFMGQVIPAHILEYQRRDKAVFYGESGLVEAGDLVFVIYLGDTDGAHYDQLDLPKDLQAEVQGILESFTRIEARGAPPTPTPTPPAIEAARTWSTEAYGFAFRYPSSWALSEVPERSMDTGKCADALVLSQGTLVLTIQYLHTSQCCEQVGWCGVGWILEPTNRDQVAMLGKEASRTLLVDSDEVKAVDVSYVDEGVDLALMITLRNTSRQGHTATEMAAIPELALAEFDQILASFETQ